MMPWGVAGPPELQVCSQSEHCKRVLVLRHASQPHSGVKCDSEREGEGQGSARLLTSFPAAHALGPGASLCLPVVGCHPDLVSRSRCLLPAAEKRDAELLHAASLEKKLPTTVHYIYSTDRHVLAIMQADPCRAHPYNQKVMTLYLLYANAFAGVGNAAVLAGLSRGQPHTSGPTTSRLRLPIPRYYLWSMHEPQPRVYVRPLP
jgi:hypothetical protein